MSDRPAPLIALAAVAAMVWATSARPVGAAEDSSRGFLARLYAHYPVAGKAHPFDPVGSQAPQVFDASLVSLIRRDQDNAREEVGALDGDPLCDCQDDGGMTWKITKVATTGAGKAVGEVRLFFPDTPKPRIDDLRLDLVKTSKGWRIHDIASTDTPSLRGLLLPTERRSSSQK